MRRASMVTASLPFALAALALAAPSGCGISTDAEDLFGGASGAAGATAAGSTSGKTSATVGATTSAASSGGEGGGATAATSTSGPGPTTTASTASVTSTSTGSPGATIDCGATQCPVGAESACCWDEYQLNGGSQAECVEGPPLEDGCDTGQQGLETRIECQTAETCAGWLCCGDRVTFQFQMQSVTYYASVTCQPQCPWPDVTLCDLADPICPVVTIQGVPTQTICKPSDILPPGYMVCGTP